jgi:hypothetical protein
MLLLYGYKIDLYDLEKDLGVKKVKKVGASQVELFREHQQQLYIAMQKYLLQDDKFETIIKVFRNGVLYIGWSVENDARTDGVDPSVYTLEVVTSDKLLSKTTTTSKPRIFLIDYSTHIDRNKISPDLGPVKEEDFPTPEELEELKLDNDRADRNDFICGTMEYYRLHPPDPNAPRHPDLETRSLQEVIAENQKGMRVHNIKTAPGDEDYCEQCHKRWWYEGAELKYTCKRCGVMFDRDPYIIPPGTVLCTHCAEDFQK